MTDKECTETGVPLVTIGIPVYNGAAYIAATLDSVLAQSHEHLEIIVSDNASTDRTPEILEEYAERDSRIRLILNPTNLGAAPNYNRTFALARGEFFKWAAHDDLCEPTFISTCVEALRNDDRVVLAYPESEVIDV